MSEVKPNIVPTFRTPWGGTAPPPPLRNIQIQREAALAAPAAGVVLALPEVLGVAPLGRILYALASGKSLADVEHEYFQRLYQGSVWQAAGVDSTKMRRDVEAGSLLLTTALAPALPAAGRQALVEAAKRFAVGGAVTAGVTTPIAALQVRPLSEIQQIALESFLAGGSLADVVALGRQGLRALADRLKTLQTRADVLNFIRRTGGDQAVNEFLLRYNAELDAFRAEANKLPTAELLKLRDFYENALKEFETNKTWRLDEPVWKIRDKLDVIDEILRSRPTPTSDIIDLQYAVSFGPQPKVTPPPEVKDLLKKIGRARLEELAKLETVDVPTEWRHVVDAAIQRRLVALKARGVRANIERQLPDGLRQELEDLIQRKVMELKTGVPRGDEGPRVRFEPQKEPPPGGGGRVETPRRGVELLTRDEQTPSAVPKVRVEHRVPKVEVKPKDEQSVKTKSEDRAQTDEKTKTETESKTDEKTSTKTETESTVDTTTTKTEPTVDTTAKAETDTAPVRVDAVPANAVLYTVTPTAMIYRVGDTFYAVLKSGDILMYPPGKVPPGVGDGGGGGWVPWGREGRSRRLRGEKMKVY